MQNPWTNRSDLETVLISLVVQRTESQPTGSPVVRFYRSRESFFRFLQKRCGLCRRPPNVLYYDSSHLGFVCDECHLRAMSGRIESILSRRRIDQESDVIQKADTLVRSERI